MEKLVLTIPTLYGDHHTTAVRRLLESLPGVSNLLVSAAYRQVSLTYDAGKTPLQAIEKTLADQGYAPGEGELTFPIQTTFAEEATRHTASISGTGTSLAFAEVTHVVQGRPLWPCPGFDPRTPHTPN
jgi:copper chaperone CopZ